MYINVIKLVALIFVGASLLTHLLYLLPHQGIQVFRPRSWVTPLRVGLFVLFLIDTSMFWLYADSLFSRLAVPPINPYTTLIIPAVLLIHTTVFVFFSRFKFPQEG